MISRWVRTWDSRVFKPFLSVLSHLGVTPNELTLASLGFTIVAGFLIGIHQTAWGIVALVIGSIFDVLDGELARFRNMQTTFGSFLDSICDHYGDLALYLGFLWRFISSNNHTGIILVMLAMFGSLFGSHVRSRAGMVGIDLKKVGLFTRLERTLVMIIGGAANQVMIAFWILAVMNNFTALQRILFASRVSRQEARILEGSKISEH